MKVLTDVFANVASYTIIDLDGALALQIKYISNFPNTKKVARFLSARHFLSHSSTSSSSSSAAAASSSSSAKSQSLEEAEMLDRLEREGVHLVIPHYAWIECAPEVRDVHWHRIMGRSRRGYVISNNPWTLSERNRLMEQQLLDVVLTYSILINPMHAANFSGDRISANIVGSSNGDKSRNSVRPEDYMCKERDWSKCLASKICTDFDWRNCLVAWRPLDS